MRCNCLDLMGDSPNFRGKNCEQSMGKLEFKRKKNKSKERKSNKHFIYYLIALSKKSSLSLLHFRIDNFEDKHLFCLPL